MRIFISSCLCLISLGLVACGKDPQVLKREYFESGKTYLKAGKPTEAAIQFRNAIQQDNNFGEARYELAQVLASTGDFPGAYREFVRAADLLPDRIDVQIKAGEANLPAGRFQEAQARAERALALDANNIDAHVLKGAALAGLKDLDAAIDQVENAIELDPNRGPNYTNLGMLHLAAGNAAEAAKSFVRATELAPTSITARMALANFYWSSGQRDATERTLRDALAINAKDVYVNRVLAYFLMVSNRAAEAEPHLKMIADETRDPLARAALADYYRQTGREQEAMQVLDLLYKEEKGFAIAGVRRAAIMFARGEKREAYLTIDAVLGKEPRNVGALLLKAQLLAVDRKLDDALVAVQAAVAAEPTAIPAQFALGRIQAARGNTADAVAAMTEALRLSPRLAAAHVVLAQIYLASGRLDEASRSAQDALATQPDYPEGRLVQARVHLAKRNTAAAEQALNALSAAYPGAAVVHAQIGTLHVLKRDLRAARRAFERALMLDDMSPDALEGLLLLDAAEKKLPGALERIQTRLAKQPDSAALLIIAARTHVAAGDAAAAEQALKQAISAEPSNITAYSLLGQIYISQRRIDEAIGEYAKVSTRNPKSVAPHTLIGMLLQASNRSDEARARYKQALAIDSTAPVAANNLAWLYAESNSNMDEALQLAQAAKSRLPESADVADTLGWIYFKKGLYTQAVTELAQSVETQPGNAVFQYISDWRAPRPETIRARGARSKLV